jgi:hypothetical protein
MADTRRNRDDVNEIKEARIFGGIHFRFSCDDGQVLGAAVAQYVLAHSLLPVWSKS